MILPHSYAVTLGLMILAMLCWGSWANTYKLTGKWRFELFYFDYAFGLLFASIVYAFTVGNLGFDGFSFIDDVMHAGKRQWAYGLASGVIFNFANILLLAAISVVGMAVAFPICMGTALVVSVGLGYLMEPAANPALLLAGCGLIAAAVALDAMAYGRLAVLRHEELAKAGKAKSTRRPSSIKGVILPLVSGVLMGTYFPLVANAQEGEIGLGPYSVTVMFALGAFLSTFVFNLFFMNLPVEGEPVDIFDYFKGRFKRHALGILGGIIWCTGAVAIFVAAYASVQATQGTTAAEQAARVAPSTSFALAHGAALVAVLWGALAWKEFKGADTRVKALAVFVFLLFGAGLAVVALAQAAALP